MPPRFDSIIFDLDGTLWNATETVARAFQDAKNQVDYITNDITAADVQAVTGQPYQLVYDKLFPYLTDEQRQEFRQIISGRELRFVQEHGGTLYPELRETLAYLAGKYRLFIVSNCQTGYIEAFLRHSQLGQFFEGHQCFGTRHLPKFENINEVVAQYGLQVPVYVGDTRSDFEASQKSGLPFIFAAYGFGQVDGPVVARLAQVSDLRRVL